MKLQGRKKRKVEDSASLLNIVSENIQDNGKTFVEVALNCQKQKSPVLNGTNHVIKKPDSFLVRSKQGMLMKYFQKVKKCLILKKTQLAKTVKSHLNQKTLENVALWMLGYVAKSYHYLRVKVEEHANDSMEVKDLSMRS